MLETNILQSQYVVYKKRRGSVNTWSTIRPLIDAEYAVHIMKQLYGMEVNTCHRDVNITDSQSPK